MCWESTANPASTYRPHMKGTSLPATLPMRLMPPTMTSPTTTARMIPLPTRGTPK